MMTSHLPGGSEGCCNRNCLDYIHNKPATQSCGVSSEASWLQHVVWLHRGSYLRWDNRWWKLWCFFRWPRWMVSSLLPPKHSSDQYCTKKGGSLTGKPFVSHHWFVLHLEEQLFGLMYSHSPERFSMRDTHYKGFSGLTRQSPSTAVHNGPWDL